MKHLSSHKRAASLLTQMMALAAIAAISACSPKPSAEDTAAKNKAIAEQAIVEAKKEILAEQAAEKAKQDAAAAAQAEEKAKQEAAEKEKHSKAAANATPAKHASCANCGVVVAVNEVETAGKGSGAGVVAGGIVGGLLGHQVGNGTGRDLATIAGVVGGAVAGNKIEENAKKSKSYNITVKLESGEEKTVHQAAAPNVARGDKVKIENNVIVKK